MPPKKPTNLTPESPITALPGISETRGALFAKLGIETLADLCRHYPRTYEIRGKMTTVADALSDGCGKDAPGSFAAYIAQKSVLYAMEMPGSRYDIGTVENYYNYFNWILT